MPQNVRLETETGGVTWVQERATDSPKFTHRARRREETRDSALTPPSSLSFMNPIVALKRNTSNLLSTPQQPRSLTTRCLWTGKEPPPDSPPSTPSFPFLAKQYQSGCSSRSDTPLTRLSREGFNTGNWCLQHPGRPRGVAAGSAPRSEAQDATTEAAWERSFSLLHNQKAGGHSCYLNQPHYLCCELVITIGHQPRCLFQGCTAVEPKPGGPGMQKNTWAHLRHLSQELMVTSSRGSSLLLHSINLFDLCMFKLWCWALIYSQAISWAINL